MHTIILYAKKDRSKRKVIDRYLFQMERDKIITYWNDDLVLPGNSYNDEMLRQMGKADLILLLMSQDFLASDICYKQAEKALQLAKENHKDVAVILLRPSGVMDTIFKDLKHLPAEGRWITKYKDLDKGYWDTYQEIRKIINPNHVYEEKPQKSPPPQKRNYLRIAMFTSIMLFLLCLLPILFPQRGLRIEPKPYLKGDTMVYNVHKMDNEKYKEIVLSFSLSSFEIEQYGPMYDRACMDKIGDTIWDDRILCESKVYLSIEPRTTPSQCITVTFKGNDEGLYAFRLKMVRPLDESTLDFFKGKLRRDSSPCYCSESNQIIVEDFKFWHWLFLPLTQFFFKIAFLISVLCFTFFHIKTKLV